jgi:UDP-N-acetylglucosamine acyltransferase
MPIHATAIIDPAAQLAPDVSIGPYCIVGPHVRIDAGTELAAHVILEGRVHLGQRNRVASFACIGGAPQDKKYAGEETSVEIGDDNTIREYVTINRGTVQDAAVTRIGHRNWIMAYVHFAHDCQIGNDTIFANACQVAGHVHVDDWAILGATTLVHQFVRIGAHSFTAMGTFLQQDLPCYVTAAGNPAQPYGINSEGLRRRGFSADAIAAIKRAYKAIYRSGQRLEEARQQCLEIQQQHPEVAAFSEFLSRATRGIIR